MEHTTHRTFNWILGMLAALVIGGCQSDLTQAPGEPEEVESPDVGLLGAESPGVGLLGQDAGFDGEVMAASACFFIRYDNHKWRHIVDSYRGYLYENPVKTTSSGGQVVDFEWGGVNLVTDDLVRHSCEHDPTVLLQLYSPFGSYVLDRYDLEAYIGAYPALVLVAPSGDVIPKTGIYLRLVRSTVLGLQVLDQAEVTIIGVLDAPHRCRYQWEGPLGEDDPWIPVDPMQTTCLVGPAD